jgi:1-acyl-sn-glycerol-3-phosphate acyltransferase
MRRRTMGIGGEILGFVAISVLFPLLLAAAAAVDAVLWLVKRKPWMACRMLAIVWWLLFAELRAMAALIWIYATTGGPLGRGTLRRRRLIYGLRIHWCRSHLAGAKAILGLRLDVEGLEQAAPGPVFIMPRHTSIIDNTLPDALIGHTHRIGIRVVLKREIEVIPVIDIGGRWIPTNFVRRGSGETEREVDNVRRIAQRMGEQEAVLIYPEGTRASPKKIARAKEIVAERQPDLAERANRLRHVLPPRLGGPLALLDEAPEVDVVFCAHVGLDGFAYLRDLWSGGLLNTTVKVRYWRVPASTIPRDHDGRVTWLYEQWQAVDDWVDEQLAGASER